MSYLGMNAATGAAITDELHLSQSVNQIFTTPVGSRIMRRLFGSLLPDLIDHPFNDSNVVLLYAATATALVQHEPRRLRLTRVSLTTDPDQPGATHLKIDGVSNFSGQPRGVSINVPITPGT